MKKLVALFFCLVGVAGIYFSWSVISFLSSPAQAARAEIIFEVPSGTAFYSIADRLETRGVVSDSRKFSWLAKALRQTTNVKVGEYRLYTDMRPREVLRVLTSGNSISYPLMVPEGYNIFEIRDALEQMWPGRGQEFFSQVTDSAFIRALTGDNLSSLEGYLFPDTYAVTKYTSMEALVRHMYDRFQQEIAEVNKTGKLKMPLHDQVILASVIEKETGAPGERQLISSVFHNRLKRGMKLQSDPTILYGILIETKEMKKNITKADIHRATPYNTYTVRALPVGPIANPGRDALWAALNPVDSEYLYFVSRNNGTTYFSENYETHNKAVRDYQINPAGRKGRSWRDLKKPQAKEQPKKMKR